MRGDDDDRRRWAVPIASSPLRRVPCLQTCPRWTSSDGSRSRPRRRWPSSTSAAGRLQSGGPRPEGVPRRVEEPWSFFFFFERRSKERAKSEIYFASSPLFVLQSKEKKSERAELSRSLSLSPFFLSFDPSGQSLACSIRHREQRGQGGPWPSSLLLASIEGASEAKREKKAGERESIGLSFFSFFSKKMETQLTYNNKSRHLGIRFRERYTTREGLQAKVRSRESSQEPKIDERKQLIFVF